jgi:MoaA/NifB/PqqE/SkfB family radical SAM enzyme
MVIEWGDPLEHLQLFPRNNARLFILEISATGAIRVSTYLPITLGNVLKHSLKEYWDHGLKDAWRHPVVQEYARKIECIEDLSNQDPVPWEGEYVELDLVEA